MVLLYATTTSCPHATSCLHETIVLINELFSSLLRYHEDRVSVASLSSPDSVPWLLLLLYVHFPSTGSTHFHYLKKGEEVTVL